MRPGLICIFIILNLCGQPNLVAVSNTVAFENPNAPNYPRLAQGKMWDEVSSPLSTLILASHLYILAEILTHLLVIWLIWSVFYLKRVK